MKIQDEQIHQLVMDYIKLNADKLEISTPDSFAKTYWEVSAQLRKAIVAQHPHGK